VQGTILAKHGARSAYLMIMVDSFTKAIELATLTDKSAPTMARAFWDTWICRFGLPDIVITDQGSEFQSPFRRMLMIRLMPTKALQPKGQWRS
jgi:transposase InsO family protein